MDDAEARLVRLEERYTHLQRHVAEQDRVILDLAGDIQRLREELAHLRALRSPGGAPADDLPADERPPHY